MHPLKTAFSVTLVSTLLLAGCAGQKQITRVLYPYPPDEPKFEWLQNCYNEFCLPASAATKTFRKTAGAIPEYQLNQPFGIASDSKGKVYVSEAAKGNIIVFDFNRGSAGILAKERNYFKNPAGLWVDREGNLLVADFGHRKVLVLSPQGDLLSAFGDEVLKKPGYVAVNDRNGRIYVSDTAENKVFVFDHNGQHLFSIDGLGGPQGLAIAPDDRLFVADMLNARVAVFDADGKFLNAFGEMGSHYTQFEFPKDLAFDSEGHLHVVDSRKAAIMSYEPDGRLLLVLTAGKTTKEVGFLLPSSISIDANDRVWVADLLARRFAIWQYLSPAYLREHPIADQDLERLLEIKAKRARASEEQQPKNRMER